METIEARCGPNNQVGRVLDDLSALSDQFFEVSKAITDAYNALSCPRIHGLYVQAVHEGLCTDFATANTNGLLLLIAMSFCGMTLITLRASWRSSSTGDTYASA